MMDDIYYSKSLFFVQPGYLHNSLGLFAERCSQKLLPFPFFIPKIHKYDTGGLFISGKEVESYNFPGADAYLINRIIRLTKCSFDCSRLSQLVNGTCCRVGEGKTKTRKILSFSLLLFLIPK